MLFAKWRLIVPRIWLCILSSAHWGRCQSILPSSKYAISIFFYSSSIIVTSFLPCLFTQGSKLSSISCYKLIQLSWTLTPYSFAAAFPQNSETQLKSHHPVMKIQRKWGLFLRWSQQWALGRVPAIIDGAAFSRWGKFPLYFHNILDSESYDPWRCVNNCTYMGLGGNTFTRPGVSHSQCLYIYIYMKPPPLAPLLWSLSKWRVKDVIVGGY